ADIHAGASTHLAASLLGRFQGKVSCTKNPPSSSACGVAAIYSEWVTNHEACARATEPKNGGCDLLRPTKSPNRLLFQDVFHGVWFLSQHARNHRRFDGPGANRVDANASSGAGHLAYCG